MGCGSARLCAGPRSNRRHSAPCKFKRNDYDFVSLAPQFPNIIGRAVNPASFSKSFDISTQGADDCSVLDIHSVVLLPGSGVGAGIVPHTPDDA